MYKKKVTRSAILTSPIAFFLYGLFFLLPAIFSLPPDPEDLQVTTVAVAGLDSETHRSGRFGTETDYYLVTRDGIRYRLSGGFNFEELDRVIRETYEELNEDLPWFNPDGKYIVYRAEDKTPVTAEIWYQDSRIYILSIDGIEYVSYDPSEIPFQNIFLFVISLPYFAFAVGMVTKKHTGGKWTKENRAKKHEHK